MIGVCEHAYRCRLCAFPPSGHDGRVTEIALPFEGTIGAIYTVNNEDGALISLAGWLTPAGIYSVGAAGHVADTGITPKAAIDVNAYEAKRFFAVAKDGTKIPYSLIYRKGLKLDGTAPTWISAYGSYGIAAYTPAFAGRTLALVDAAVVVDGVGAKSPNGAPSTIPRVTVPSGASTVINP